MSSKPHIIIPDKKTYEEGSLMIVEDIESVFFALLMEENRLHAAEISDFALRYMAGVMADFSNPDNLFENTEGRLELQPLALIFGEMADTQGHGKISTFKKLGDSALYRAGFMADYYKRKPVDVDYCMDMGRAAYGSLSALLDEDVLYGFGKGLYSELTGKFSTCVGLVSEIAKKSGRKNINPVMLDHIKPS